MPNKDGPLSEAADLSEVADAIARGRALVQQAQRSAEKADQQMEDAQAAMERSDRALDRSQQLLDDLPGE
jgi:methyl-accepting chemotaxis protein